MESDIYPISLDYQQGLDITYAPLRGLNSA